MNPALMDPMSTSSVVLPTRGDLDRRQVLGQFGLATAGVILGSYVSPALASFRPPAALVGSDAVLFWEEFRRVSACDGPACNIPAQYMYSVNSSTFEGVVRLSAQPVTQPAGWAISFDKSEIAVQPGDQIFVRLIMDTYTDPMVGAFPPTLNVRVTARAFPADGSPSFTIGTHMAIAHVEISTLRFGVPAHTVQVNSHGLAECTEMLIGEFIDSSTFGPVLVQTMGVPAGWEVSLDKVSIPFGGSGQVPVLLRIRVPAGSASNQTVRVLAVLDHPSFAAPMQTAVDVTVLV